MLLYSRVEPISATQLRSAVISGELWLEMQMASGPMTGAKYYACKVRKPDIAACLIIIYLTNNCPAGFAFLQLHIDFSLFATASSLYGHQTCKL